MFYGCTSLVSAVIGDGVKSISNSAFNGCTSLASVIVGNSVRSIEDFAFSGCTALTIIEIPKSVTSIGASVFRDCKGLTAINVDEDNLNYSSENGVLYNKNKTTLMLYPSMKTEISFVIPSSVTTIDVQAFKYCSFIENVSMGNDVISMGNYAFYNCTNLTNITISESLTSISDYAFYNCANLLSVIIPDSVTSIGSHAFERCQKLASITIGSHVTKISQWAFAYCSMTNIVIPNSVTSIGNASFYVCSSLVSLTIPDSVTSISYRAFNYCRSLKSVYFEGTNTTLITNIGSESFMNGKTSPNYVQYHFKTQEMLDAAVAKRWNFTFKKDNSNFVLYTFTLSIASEGIDIMYNIEDDTGIVAQGYVNNGKMVNVVLSDKTTSGQYTIIFYINYLNKITSAIVDDNVLMLSDYTNNYTLKYERGVEFFYDCTLSITGTSVSGDLNNSIIV